MKSRFVFSLRERNGILYLMCFLLLLFIFTFIIKQFIHDQTPFDQILLSEKLDNISNEKSNGYPFKKKFNPNYVSDYFGYTLGLSTAEIDALHSFRSTGNYINSVKDFQKVTGVSDKLLAQIAPGFKFPQFKKFNYQKADRNFISKRTFEKSDLNKADSLVLLDIYGIGPVLSGRILKYRKLLGGFYSDSQLYEVYGLNQEAAKKVLEKFTVISKPQITQKNINLISLDELTHTPYISYKLARAIIAYRSKVGRITKIDELTKIQEFPTEKINIIEVYLTIK